MNKRPSFDDHRGNNGRDPADAGRTAATPDRRAILVTGSHRSGSTWVGRTLDQSPAVGYIHEPFNVDFKRPGICSAVFHHWFTYVTQQNEAAYYEPLRRTLAFRYNLLGELRARAREGGGGRGGIRNAMRGLRDFRSKRRAGVRPLLKDPIAVFSAEWLAARFPMDVVVVVRHPAAFASSLKRKDWTFPFFHLLEQPLLLEDHLRPFREEIRQFAAREHDIIDQASLLWTLIHSVILRYQERHEDWIFLRHEDLSRDPLPGFEALFGQLGLPWTADIRSYVQQTTNSSNPIGPTGREELRRRDSRANIQRWKEMLSEGEIGRIRARVDTVSAAFYSDNDW